MSLPKRYNKGIFSAPKNSINILPSNEEVEALLKSFPAGFHFKPRDEELIVHYLRPKLFNKPLPPHKIKDVDLYHYNPETLAANISYGEGEWYFFTPRDKKYKKGSRPRRAAGDGYWKATGADRTIMSKGGGVEVGYRKALVFYRGKPPKGDKTDWMMHEYRLKDPPARLNKPFNSNSIHDDMRLDDWVLCKIYKKSNKYLKAAAKRQQEENHEDEHELDRAVINPSVEEANNVVFLPHHQQAGGFMNFGSEYGGGNMNGLAYATSPKSYYYDHDHDHATLMLEKNPSLLLDNTGVSDICGRNFMPEMLGLPSSLAMPPMDSLDQFINDLQDEEKLPHFKFDNHH
ncbi:hypothetical protein PTKIN_Ptkin07bG0095100 [Pterospermum kingtungense]